jgi:hypothetical protein
MMLIARLFPKKSMEKLWEYVEEKIEKESSGLATPLYASQTEGSMEVSIVFRVNHPDNIAHFLTDCIADCEEVHNTKTITLMKPVFFPIPKDKPQDVKRYIIHINTHPQYYKDFYNLLVNYDYPTTMFPIFLSYSLGDEDMIVNIAADSIDTVRDFIHTVIQPVKGLEAININQVIKAKRFVPLSKLVEHQKKYLTEKAESIPDEDIDLEFDWTFDEYAKMTGAFSREL